MVIETEPKHITKDTLTIIINLENGTDLSFPDQKWYKAVETLADAFHRKPTAVNPRLHNIIKNNPSIKVTTIGDLKTLGKSSELDHGGRPQTIICDQENLKKIVLAYSLLKKPGAPRKESDGAKKDKSRKKPTIAQNDWHTTVESDKEEPNPFSSSNNCLFPEGENRLRPPTSKDVQTIEMSLYGALAVNSVSYALLRLADGTLQEITTDLGKYLEEIAKEHIESAFHPKKLLNNALWDTSLSRLKRFFHTSLDSYLDSSWEAIDGHQKISEEEKGIIETCNRLKEKGYHKEKVIEEIDEHFAILIPRKYA